MMKNLLKSVTTSSMRWKTQLVLGRWLQRAEHRLGLKQSPSRSVLVSFSYLFRDVSDYLVPLRLDYTRRGQALRILSAGCATGQEAYSIAILCQDLGIPVSILAIDLSSTAIATARQGRYDLVRERQQSDDIDTRAAAAYIDRYAGYFQSVVQGEAVGEVAPQIKQLVTFERADVCNLRYPPEFDFVVCRKMLYYLARAEQLKAIRSLRSVLKPERDRTHLILDGYTLKQPCVQSSLAEAWPQQETAQ